MAFSLSLPTTASAWAELPGELVHEFRAAVSERPISRPELTPEQRALRIATERLMLERGSAALSASRWPR
jgi:hypothetical protein